MKKTSNIRNISGYDFSKLNNENNYSCAGSGCTCKFLKDRTQYDKQQYLQYQQGNSIDYGTNMFRSFKKK